MRRNQTCSVCNKKAVGRGLCATHYQQARRAQPIVALPTPPRFEPTFPAPALRIGSSLVPASAFVKIEPINERPLLAQAVFDDDGSFDCWYSEEGNIYWGHEVMGWNPISTKP